MGEVIRRAADADDIFVDLSKTIDAAAAQGGLAQELSEERLVPVLTQIDSVRARQAEAEAQARGPIAKLMVANDAADTLLARSFEKAWDAVGRPGPGRDAALSLLFPGGSGYYADESVDQQPERMELLAELVESGVHKKLPAETAKAIAADVRAEAGKLAAAVDAAARPRARVELLRRMKTVLARHAQAELVNLKRRLKSEGFSEADIHSIIPDRPSEKPAPKVGEAPAA